MNRRRRRKGDKGAALAVHARRRALQRFDVELTDADLAALVVEIQTGRAVYLDRQSNRVTRWCVELPGGAPAVAAYDAQRKQIVTFIPPDWIAAGKEGP